jgi:hypothetical protein
LGAFGALGLAGAPYDALGAFAGAP